jgi:ADP-heptose:LPS heptosyltransferase
VRVINPRPVSPPARRILVIRLSALGDVVRTRFAFEGLRQLYPDARIDWLVEDRAASGLEGIRGLDDVIRIPRGAVRLGRPLALWQELRSLVQELRSREYELAVDFHGILKSALLARAAHIPVRVGFDRPFSREGSAYLLTDRAVLDRKHVSRFDRNAALVRFLGGVVPEGAPALDLPEPHDDEGVELEAYIVVHPGTSAATLYKRWDPANYAQVCRELASRAGVRSLVTWGPVEGEYEAALEVVGAAGDAAVLAPRTRSVSHLLRLMRGGRIFLGSDSGPMHLASLAGLPVVAIFGPTDPVENAPYAGLPVRLLREDVGCNPCREGCPARVCMASVAAERVTAAALELLENPAPT